MNRLKNLQEIRAAKEVEMSKIMKDCENEKRSRTEAEKLKWQSLQKEVTGMDEEIKDLEKQNLIDMRSAKPVNGIEQNQNRSIGLFEDDKTESRSFLDKAQKIALISSKNGFQMNKNVKIYH